MTGAAGKHPRRPTLHDADMVVAAAATSLAVWGGAPGGRLAVGAAAAVWSMWPRRRAQTGPRMVVVALMIALVVAGSHRSDSAWNDVASGRTGDYEGWATVVRESQTYERSTRIIIEIEGERYETWAYGRSGASRLAQWQAGDRIAVSGTRRALRPDRVNRVAWQHVVGQFEMAWAADRRPGSALDRMSNWVREGIEGAAERLRAADGALYRGLVIGDDRDQPREMVERFRATGLAHLTAASGLNLVYVLALFGPLLRTMPPWLRWGATCLLIGWYVVVTRFEPSIVRAGVMGIIAATAYVRGQPQKSIRTVSLAVILLVLIDPLLVWSVGFWMSVGGTAGIVMFARPCAERLAALGPLALPVGVTVGAEIGVAPANILVFNRVPLVSIPANVLTGPAAGFAKLYGLPAGVVADSFGTIGDLVMLPLRFAVRWIDTVALVGDAVGPGPRASLYGWTAILAVMGALLVLRPSSRRPGDARTTIDRGGTSQIGGDEAGATGGAGPE